jgi:hypothetical protein
MRESVVLKYNSTHVALAGWYNPLTRHLMFWAVCIVAVVGPEPPEDKRRKGGKTGKGENRRAK